MSTETVKNLKIYTPETRIASGSNPVHEGKNNNIIQTNPSSNVDVVGASNKTIGQIYNLIEEICAEYRMDMKLVKELNLLEKIAGCSSKELTLKSDKEIEAIIKALKTTLTRDWKAFWLTRDKDDIIEIANDANMQYVRQITGGNWLEQKVTNFLTEDSLIKELAKNDYLPSDKTAENVTDDELKGALKKYFIAKYLGDIESKTSSGKIATYKEALKNFGYLANIIQDSREKAILTAVVAELSSNDRLDAIKALLVSCKNEAEACQEVAKNINHEEVAMKKDALGNRCSDEDATGLAYLKYNNLSQEDHKKAISDLDKDAKEFYSEENQAKLKSIKEKIARGEALTEDEQYLYDKSKKVYVSQYSGAQVSAITNEYLADEYRVDVVNHIEETTTTLNIVDEVYETTNTYINSENSEVKAEFVAETLNKYTDNEYSRIVSLTNNTKDTKVNNVNNVSLITNEKPNVYTKEIESKFVSDENRVSIIENELTDTKPCNGVKYVSNVIKADESKNTSKIDSEKTEEKFSQVESLKEVCAKRPEAVSKYIFEHRQACIKEVFESNKGEISTWVENIAIRHYQDLRSKEKIEILEKLSTPAIDKALQYTDKNTILLLKNKNLYSYYANFKVEQYSKRIEKENYSKNVNLFV